MLKYLLAFLLLISSARADTLQIVTAWQAGGVNDLVARAFASTLAQTTGQQAVVINREGGAGIVGAVAVSQARPDGTLLGIGPITPITSTAYRQNPPVATVNDFAFVCKLHENILAVAVKPSSPYSTMADLLADIRKNPDQLAVGATGYGQTTWDFTAQRASLKTLSAAYRGDAAIALELEAGRLAFAVMTLAGAQNAGLKILAQFNFERGNLPQIPTVTEYGLETLHPVMAGIFVPRATAPSILDRLEFQCRAVSQSTDFNNALSRLNLSVAYSGRQAFEEAARQNAQQNRELLQKSGVP